MSAVLTYDGSGVSVMPTDHRPAQPILSQQTVLLQVIARAAQDTSIDLGRMQQLMEMHERLNRHDAKRQFAEAMAAFKAAAPRIFKEKRANMGQGRPSYSYASLGNVVDAIVTGLAAVGISHSWTLKEEGSRIHVTCVLTHKGGYSKRVPLSGPLDNSGAKNAIQSAGSTITYLERYTLLAAVGLASEDDDDGHGARQQQETRRDPPPREEPPVRREPERTEPPPSQRSAKPLPPISESELADITIAIRECEEMEKLVEVFGVAATRARRNNQTEVMEQLTKAKDARKAQLAEVQS